MATHLCVCYGVGFGAAASFTRPSEEGLRPTSPTASLASGWQQRFTLQSLHEDRHHGPAPASPDASIEGRGRGSTSTIVRGSPTAVEEKHRGASAGGRSPVRTQWERQGPARPSI